MNISSVAISENSTPRRNLFIKYSNNFMSFLNNNEGVLEKTKSINPTVNNKKDKSMGIETLTIFPKEIKDGKMIITA